MLAATYRLAVDDINRGHNITADNRSLLAVIQQHRVDLTLDLDHGIHAAVARPPQDTGRSLSETPPGSHIARAQ